MNTDDHVCVCHKVSLGKLVLFVERENPKVASQLSECLGAGTGCGWCIPFLEKLHKQHVAGEPLNLGVEHDRYTARRRVYKDRNAAREKNNE